MFHFVGIFVRDFCSGIFGWGFLGFLAVRDFWGFWQKRSKWSKVIKVVTLMLEH